jgi:hypothetical protein
VTHNPLQLASRLSGRSSGVAPHTGPVSEGPAAGRGSRPSFSSAHSGRTATQAAGAGPGRLRSNPAQVAHVSTRKHVIMLRA